MLQLGIVMHLLSCLCDLLWPCPNTSNHVDKIENAQEYPPKSLLSKLNLSINPTFPRWIKNLSFPNFYQIDYMYTNSIAFPNDEKNSPVLYIINYNLSGILFRWEMALLLSLEFIFGVSFGLLFTALRTNFLSHFSTIWNETDFHMRTSKPKYEFV